MLYKGNRKIVLDDKIIHLLGQTRKNEEEDIEQFL